VLIDSIICLFVSFSLFDVHVYLVQGYWRYMVKLEYVTWVCFTTENI
jgi:hypothetical protein